MRCGRTVIAALALLAFALPAGAEDANATLDRLDRFKLWNYCGPVELLVLDFGGLAS